MKLYEHAKGVIEKLEKLNSDNESCLEMHFMLFVESTFDGKYLAVDNICINCAEKNLAGSFANMTLGASKYRNKDFALAKEYLIAGLNAVPSHIPGWILLCRTLRKMYNWAEIQQVSSRGLKILKKEEAHEDVSLQFKLQIYYLTSLLENNNSFDERTYYSATRIWRCFSNIYNSLGQNTISYLFHLLYISCTKMWRTSQNCFISKDIFT